MSCDRNMHKVEVAVVRTISTLLKLLSNINNCRSTCFEMQDIVIVKDGDEELEAHDMQLVPEMHSQQSTDGNSARLCTYEHTVEDMGKIKE